MPLDRCRAGYRPRDPADGTWTVIMAVTTCLPPLRDRAILGYSDLTEIAGTTTLGCWEGIASLASDRDELEACTPVADSKGSSASGSEVGGLEIAECPLTDRMDGAANLELAP